ncbi:unnamed protein product [Rotaria socialis]|uniref:VCBS repeat-containing protein n=1 Tax=Rotaria socialis TaxID=392032 RepID=A0A820GTZ5_9BILA|nr:unnamed protein product [Rotaria socialis]CAF3423890.1 unnamed protein product [Rotaria socialis]CAF3428886.1 unnamed protein product [Rotaria socialis]CAF4225399.1 unnamed protein product [Rotaria socialis]CAF4282883.1 unnamed protein product [Rotaria socialis]
MLSNDVSILFGYGNGSFANQITYSTGSDGRAVVVGDSNKDTRLDIVAINYMSNDISVLLGYGNDSFANKITYYIGFSSSSIAVGDLNNTILEYSTDSSSFSITVADFNNDTRLDIVVANSASGNISIFLGYGNGSFANQTTYSTERDSYPYFVAVVDFNNDTTLDIVVVNQGSNSLGTFLGYGDGTFSSMTLISMGYGSVPFSVLIGDFSHDRNM